MLPSQTEADFSCKFLSCDLTSRLFLAVFLWFCKLICGSVWQATSWFSSHKNSVRLSEKGKSSQAKELDKHASGCCLEENPFALEQLWPGEEVLNQLFRMEVFPTAFSTDEYGYLANDWLLLELHSKERRGDSSVSSVPLWFSRQPLCVGCGVLLLSVGRLFSSPMSWVQ